MIREHPTTGTTNRHGTSGRSLFPFSSRGLDSDEGPIHQRNPPQTSLHPSPIQSAGSLRDPCRSGTQRILGPTECQPPARSLPDRDMRGSRGFGQARSDKQTASARLPSEYAACGGLIRPHSIRYQAPIPSTDGRTESRRALHFFLGLRNSHAHFCYGCWSRQARPTLWRLRLKVRLQRAPRVAFGDPDASVATPDKASTTDQTQNSRRSISRVGNRSRVWPAPILRQFGLPEPD